MSDTLLTAGELARELKTDKATVLRWARTGRIPCLKMGGKFRRFNLSEVIAAIKSGRDRALGGRDV